VSLGKKLANELRVDPVTGAEQVLNWMRLAAAPAYSKNGVVGGLHLAMPAAVALNKDTMLSYSPDDLQQLVTMRKDLALIIKNSDAPKTTKIKLMQAMAPEAEAGKINMFNYQKILEGIKGEKPALGRTDQSTSTKAEINAASDKALAAYDGTVKKSAPKPAVAADAPVPVLPKKKPASAKEAGAPVGKPQSGTGSGKVNLGTASPYAAKDQAKSDRANKFIGRGSERSSTAKYAKAWGDRANSGSYTSADTVFVSAEGNRSGRIAPDFVELKRATDAGATIVTDDAANRARDYNVGERAVAGFLEKQGYSETAPGTWTKPAAQRKLNTQVATKLATSTEIARQLGFKAAPPQLADVSAKLLTDPNINPEQFIKETALGLSHLLSSGIYGEDIAKALSAPQWASMLNGLINEGKANGLSTPKAIVEARRLIVEQALRKELADRSKAEQTFVGRLTKLVKDFISRFKGVMESAEFADIVRNSLNDLVAKTAGPIDLQAGFKKVTFQEAVDADPEAASILAHLSKNPNFVLTGSIVLAANGSVYRNSANMLHDLDFVVNGTVEAAEAHMRKMFPDAVVQNSFKTNLSETFSYIVPPPGAQVVDMEYKTTPGGNRLLDSYRIVKDGKEIGRRYVSPARGEVKLGNAGDN
jgi:hypothetical protein